MLTRNGACASKNGLVERILLPAAFYRYCQNLEIFCFVGNLWALIYLSVKFNSLDTNFIQLLVKTFTSSSLTELSLPPESSHRRSCRSSVVKLLLEAPPARRAEAEPESPSRLEGLGAGDRPRCFMSSAVFKVVGSFESKVLGLGRFLGSWSLLPSIKNVYQNVSANEKLTSK